ncbi:MAG: hypothetical protein NBV67_00755 [Tagaea sp.]|nr:hypothetical protein [Tagaea sp.]
MFGFTVRMVLQAIDRATGPLAKVGRAVRAVGVLPRAVGQSLDRLSTNVGLPSVAARGMAAANSVGQVAGAASLAGLKLAGLAGIGGGGLLGLSRMTANYAEQMLMLAEKTGIGVERFQALAFAAEQSSVGPESFADAMKFLNKTIGDALSGSDEALEFFRGTRVAFRDSSGAARDTADVFMDVADAFQRSGNQQAKTLLAMKGFGRAGADMMMFLNSGRGAIEGLMEDARRLGLVMGEDTVKKAEAFGDQLSRLWQVVKMTGMAIGGALIPHLEPLVVRLVELGAELQPILASGAAGWFASLGDVMPQVISALGELWTGMRTVGAGVAWLGETFGYGTLAIVGLTAMVAGPVLVAIANLAWAVTMLGGAVMATAGKLAMLVFGPIVAAAGAFFSALMGGMPIVAAFNLALAANPIGAVILAVVALGAALVALYVYWDELGAAIGKIGAALMGGLGAALDWIGAKFDAVFGRAGRAIAGVVSVMPEGLRKTLGLAGGSSAGAVEMAPAAAMPAARTLSAARGIAGGQQTVDGQIVVRLEGPGAENARVERMAARGPLDLGLDLGPTMVAP